MIIVEDELIQLPKVKLFWGIKVQTGVVSTPKWSYFFARRVDSKRELSHSYSEFNFRKKFI